MVEKTASAHSRAGRTRLKSVDAMRATAALMVLFHHLPIGGSGPLFAGARAVSSVGLSGVSLFLVISGFSIHLRWARRSSEPFRIGNFWARRFWRLYPTFYVAACATALVTLLAGGWNGWHTPISVAPGFVPGWLAIIAEITVVSGTIVPLKWISVGWSIALEEQLYAAYSLLMRFARRINPIRLLGVAFILSLLWRVGVQVLTRSVPQGQFIDGSASTLSRMFYIQAPARGFEWVLGLVLAEAWVGNVAIPRVLRRIDVGIALLICAAAMFRWPSLELTLGHGFYVTDVLLDQVFGLGFFCVLSWTLDRERRGTGRIVDWFANLGLASYSLYLMHPIVIDQLAPHLPAAGAARAAGLIGIVVACLAAAGVTFVAVERFFVQKSQRIGARAAPPGSG